jgi:hypothetical protein
MTTHLKFVTGLALVAGLALGLTLSWIPVSQALAQEKVKAGGIFVPKAKGSGDSLDETVTTSGGGPTEKTDVVITTQGDRILGSIVAMDGAGKLRLTGAQYAGEVGVLANSIDTLLLRGNDKQAGSDELVLTNGDRVVGTLSALGTGGAIVDTECAGRLKISSKVIRTINMNKPESVLIESLFTSGRLDPWTTRLPGAWVLAESGVICNNRGSNQAPLYAKLDQKEPITMIAKLQAMDGNGLGADLVLFSDAAEGDGGSGYYGRNSLFVRFNTNQIYVQYTSNGGTNSASSRSFNNSVMGGIARVSYDPATGKVHVWIDNNDLGEHLIPTRPTTGRFVMLGSYYPLKVEWIKVVRGIVPPSGEEEGVGVKNDGGIAVQFTNKDRVSVSQISMADGQMSFTTSYGEIHCPAKSVARIQFPDKGLEEPRRQPGDVRITAGVGRLTFQFEKLTSDLLVGHSDYLGAIQIQRSALREIKFNLYR